MKTRVFRIRHGATELATEDRFAGTTDVVLSPAGREQARRLSGRLAHAGITPSHNPPEDGGFKANPPHGGPADTDVRHWVGVRANEPLTGGLRDVRRVPYERALAASTTHWHDYLNAYVDDLATVLDLETIRSARLTAGEEHVIARETASCVARMKNALRD